MNKSAFISACGRFRYTLSRTWDRTKPVLVFCMLNPSTADSLEDDRTIGRCISFATAHGYGGIVVVNLFAFRTKSPEVLAENGWLVGPDNDTHIFEQCFNRTVVAAWGAHARTQRPARIRADQVLKMLRAHASEVMALEVMPDGIPKHPLYLRNDCELRPL